METPGELCSLLKEKKSSNFISAFAIQASRCSDPVPALRKISIEPTRSGYLASRESAGTGAAKVNVLRAVLKVRVTNQNSVRAVARVNEIEKLLAAGNLRCVGKAK